MLSNCEKMVVISSTTNEWQQNHHQIDVKNLMGSTSRLMQEKPGQEPQQQQQQQQPLKCPRCDSSNTKFCYYNNYSLSQPRHFCKACKRYWTRGGTLRNVPVGGGYRKNKRAVKRPAASNSIDGTSSKPNPHPHTQSQIDINPLFYGLSTNPSEMNLPFSRFNNALGLGFSSGLIMCNEVGDDNYYRNSFNQITSNSVLSSYNPSLGSSSSPAMASLLASSLHQQKFINGCINKSTQAPNHFNNLASFEELQMTSDGETARIGVNAEEGGQNRMDWNQMEQIGLVDLDPTTLYWNTGSVGAWHDPSNIGSSVTSLI